MDKILIAIQEDFLRKVYIDFFKEENFNVIPAESVAEIDKAIFSNSLDIILLDFSFAEQDDFKILKKIKKDSFAKKIPIILFSKEKEENYKKKAVEFEVKDFVAGEYISPISLLDRIKTHLGKEKSYNIRVDNDSETFKSLAKDLGDSVKCSQCSGPLDIVMLRDLSKGNDYFKVSLICPSCKK